MIERCALANYPGPPVINPCQNPNPPVLPEQWTAAALLTPFASLPPVIAEVEYDTAINAMFIGCYTLAGGSVGILVLGDGNFWMLPDWPNSHSAVGPIQATDWIVPPTNWLAGTGAACRGLAPVLGTMSEWWSWLAPCTNGCEQPCSNPTVGTWIWFDAATRYPWRMMSIDKSNPSKLPLLGNFTMVHFASFTPGPNGVADLAREIRPSSTRRPNPHAHVGAGAWPGSAGSIAGVGDVYAQLQRSAAQADASHRGLVQQRVGQLIPGLTPLPGTCAPYQLPVWATHLYMNAIAVATSDPQPYPAEVFYENQPPQQNQASRFYLPNGSREDIILNATTTYSVNWQGGQFTCSSPPLPPGLPYMNWAARDGCQCQFALAGGPLSPNGTTIAFCCPSDHGRVFWIWYSDQGQPVMFMEVPQLCDVTFTLIDYDVWMPNPTEPFPPNVFYVPPKCQ